MHCTIFSMCRPGPVRTEMGDAILGKADANKVYIVKFSLSISLYLSVCVSISHSFYLTFTHIYISLYPSLSFSRLTICSTSLQRLTGYIIWNIPHLNNLTRNYIMQFVSTLIQINSYTTVSTVSERVSLLIKPKWS